MTLQGRTHTNSVSDGNMDSEKVEGLCFPLLFPHGEPGYTNASKSGTVFFINNMSGFFSRTV